MTEPPDEVPADDAVPAEKTPAKKTPAKKAAAKKAAAKKAAAKKAPDAPAAAVEPPAAPEQSPGSAAAAAARRARRIGGRPVAGGRGDAEGTAATPPVEPVVPVSIAPVSIAKGAASPAAAGYADLPTEAPPSAEPRTVVVTAVPAWLNWAPAAVLSAGAVVMAVLLIVFSHGVWWGSDSDSNQSGNSAAVVRERVLAAAKTCLAATNTYRYEDLDTYEAKALACAVGAFRGDLKNTIDHIVKVNAPKLKASQTAHISQGGIEDVSADGQEWTVLLYGQLDVVNTNFPKGRTDPFAAQVIVQRSGDDWLIKKLNPLSAL